MSSNPLNPKIVRMLVVLGLLAIPAFTAAGAASYDLAEGETNEGGLYLFTGSIRIDGEQDGDLIVAGQSLVVNGVVTGKIKAGMLEKVELNGEIRKEADLAAPTIRVTGTVDGDLQALGQTIEIARGAHITGSLKAGGADVTIDGTIDGDVDATGGMIVLRGTVGGDVELEAETIDIDPEARITGNLSYVTRNELELAEDEIVGGSIDWDPSGHKVKTDVDISSSWISRLIIALLVGLAAVAIFPRRTSAIVERVGGDGLRSAGVGFLTFVVVPVAGALACVLIITIPVVFIAAVIFGLLVYLAKVPVAIWIGNLILARAGQLRSSPYPAFAIGITALYLVFQVPYLGRLTWWAALFVGLGAIVLHVSDQWQQRRTPGDAATITPGAPPSSGATPAPTPQHS